LSSKEVTGPAVAGFAPKQRTAGVSAGSVHPLSFRIFV
jgi:hypothetical protein